jgi:subtilisin family serine protease
MNYATESGTSMATPHVTAAAALALANSRQLRDAAAVLYLLMASADHVPAMLGQIWNQDVGAGRLNLARLVLAARTL